LTGRKFKNAKTFESSDPADRLNKKAGQLAKLSKKNLKILKSKLKDKKTGKLLDPQEIEVFKAIIDLPFKCQHATAHYYPLLTSGGLDSYEEIKRHDSDYEPKFSTKGNIEKLQNGGLYIL
jgi:hypothetical protein